MAEVNRSYLAQVVREKKRTRRDVSLKAGLGETAVKDIINGKSNDPGAATLAAIAKEIGIDPNELMTSNDQRTTAPKRKAAKLTLGSELRAQTTRTLAHDQRLTERLRNDLIEVGEYDIRLSAGPGQLVGEENRVGVWQFNRRYIVDELRLKPANLAVVEVEGDSMAPTLSPGDRVLIDHADRNPAKPGIYALWDSNATVVKRLEKVPASDPVQVVLISDNTRHNQYRVLADQINVIGRVVWFARRL